MRVKTPNRTADKSIESPTVLKNGFLGVTTGGATTGGATTGAAGNVTTEDP